MKIRILYLAIASLTISSCLVRDYSHKVSDTLSDHFGKELQKYDYILLIPNSGCTGCISDAESFFESHVDDVRAKFIFTNIYSNKEMNIRLGKRLLQKENVFLDYENRFFFPEDEESIYPVVVKIKNGSIDKLDNLDSLLE